MKRDGKILLAGAVLVRLVAFSAVKRAGRGETGMCSSRGACCPLVPGLNTWPTKLPAGTNFAETKPAVTASETVTNGQR